MIGGAHATRVLVSALARTSLIRLASASPPSSNHDMQAACGPRHLPTLSSAQIFPFLQRDRHIAVFPDEIVEGAEIEFVALLHARVGEKF